MQFYTAQRPLRMKKWISIMALVAIMVRPIRNIIQNQKARTKWMHHRINPRARARARTKEEGGKGKGEGEGKSKDADADKRDSKNMFARLEGLIAGAVRQAVADLAPDLGMTMTPTPPAKKSRQSLKNEAVIAEAKNHTKEVKKGISVSINGLSCSLLSG